MLDSCYGDVTHTESKVTNYQTEHSGKVLQFVVAGDKTLLSRTALPTNLKNTKPLLWMIDIY